jgi:hypothetical protein
VSSFGWFRERLDGLRQRGVLLTASSAASVLIASIAVAAFAAPGSHAAEMPAVHSGVKAHADAPTSPLQILSVTPTAGSRDVNGAAQIKVTFSEPLAANTPMPTLSPHITGSWQVDGDDAVFTPGDGYLQHTKVTLNIPGGSSGVQAAGAGQSTVPDAGLMTSSVKETFTTGWFSTLRLQQLLAELGYLPLNWTASGSNPAAGNANAQLSAAYQPPSGTFSWKSGYPSNLTDQWQQGTDNILVDGAVRAFEYQHNLTMDGDAGYHVWTALLGAVAKGQDNSSGYTYALADQNLPESLTIWHNGRVVLQSPANTGIPASPTVDGTYPVYERFYFTYMQGINPDGTPYDDPVYYVSYFNGGDAVHYFPRGSYGWNQSLGCVELPWDAAAKAYPYLTYGSLVTVEGPVGG